MTNFLQKFFEGGFYFKNLEKNFNQQTFHPYKINALIFRSQECLNELKNVKSVDEISNIVSKLTNDNVLNYLYNRWNPSFIYVSTHEIYVFKFYEEDDNYTLPYNGNINKILTTLTSGVSLATNLEFSASFVEFDNDSDIYEYIASKQKDHRRNYLNLCWSRFGPVSERGTYPPLDQIESYFNKLELDLKNLKGSFIKHASSPSVGEPPVDWAIMRDVKTKFVYFNF